MIEIEIKGMDKLLARIEKAKTQKALYRIATREGAKIVAAQVKMDLPHRTGFLAAGVKVRSMDSRKEVGSRVIVGQPGTETYSGWFIEHGTKERFTKRGKSLGAVEPGHYVKNATDKVADKVVALMQQIIREKFWQA